MPMSAARFRVCSGRPPAVPVSSTRWIRCSDSLQPPREPTAGGAGKFVPQPRGSGGALGCSPAPAGRSPSARNRGPGPGSGSGRPGAPAPQGCGASIAAPSRRSRSCTNLPGRKGARRELGQDPGGRGCPRAPGDTNRHLRPGECAELPKGCSAHGGAGAARRGSGGGSREGAARLREQLGGLGRRLRGEGAAGRERESHSAAPGALGAGTQPRIRPPPGQAEAGGPRTSKTKSKSIYY
ncbi:unnamed protein product [Nyctereutes procyonoides]|uniref:(raccoon dog) hypothetical protein n=1 Tax=Nyctereutes procyonoides TaxID=34880 RepID=A0A811XWH9_NYCPR|nr:unnamed protein product [Nyctereutes procyonoides]